MKITVISGNKRFWHVQQLVKAAKRHSFDVNVRAITPSDIPQINKKTGDIIIWRSSKIETEADRALIKDALKDKLFINRSIIDLPALRYKSTQQSYLKQNSKTANWSIPNYKISNQGDFKSLLKNGSLKLPVLAKPDLGSQGRGIKLLNQAADIRHIKRLSEYIFQNFIPNSGDWRVIVIGGVPLGAMKRVAKKGSVLNNVSQGGSVAPETDPMILNQLYKMATKAASLFKLTLAGVDIIQDSTTGRFYLLEVNAVPAWNDKTGFQSIFETGVADKLMEWINEDLDKQKSLTLKVESYFKKHLSIYEPEAFHFASRLWLWTGDRWARKWLDRHERNFIGKTQRSTREILGRDYKHGRLVNQRQSFRRPGFKKYPKLAGYNSVLFKVLFAQTLYGRDIRPQAREFINDDELLLTYKKLRGDADSLRRLSSHALNFFSLVENYFYDSQHKDDLKFSPNQYTKLLPGYKELEANGELSTNQSLKLQINLLTHIIIGRSHFYAEEVTEEAYKRVCQQIEKIIDANYYSISLDNKFEFLVACKLCDYKSRLAPMILQEAQASLSWAGNFLVDTLNSEANPADHEIRSAEHRNVLYIMSQKPWRLARPSSRSKRMKKTIGAFEKVSFPDFDLIDIVAKIDTGATSGSIHATEIKEIILPTGKKALKFKPFGRESGVVVNTFSQKEIRSSNGLSSIRYVIPTTVVIQGVQYMINVSLADRSLMKVDVLIGRKFIRSHGFVVDVKRGSKYRVLGRNQV